MSWQTPAPCDDGGGARCRWRRVDRGGAEAGGAAARCLAAASACGRQPQSEQAVGSRAAACAPAGAVRGSVGPARAMATVGWPGGRCGGVGRSRRPPGRPLERGGEECRRAVHLAADRVNRTRRSAAITTRSPRRLAAGKGCSRCSPSPRARPPRPACTRVAPHLGGSADGRAAGLSPLRERPRLQRRPRQRMRGCPASPQRFRRSRPAARFVAQARGVFARPREPGQQLLGTGATPALIRSSSARGGCSFSESPRSDHGDPVAGPCPLRSEPERSRSPRHPPPRSARPRVLPGY